MYKHRVKRMGGGGSYTHFFFWGGGGHIVLKGKGRQQSLRRTVEHLLPINCQ